MEAKPESVRLQPLNSSSPDPSKGGPHGSNDEDDYDPHLHRQVPKPTNDFETLVHLLKCSLGTGILAMPQAFARAGLITGIVATIVVGILITYCLHVLVRAQYATCKRMRVPLLSYPASMTVALEGGPPALRRFARPSALTVNIFLVVYQLGICCVYILFIAENVKQMVDPHYPMSLELHMLIILGPLMAFNCIRNLKHLAPFSTVANLMTFVGLGVVIYYLLSAEKKSDDPLDLWGSIFTFPLFFGTILFALTAVGVVIALENNMKTPKSFGKPVGVLNIGMTLIVILYVAVGAIGYVFCVSDCSDSVTLDLPKDEALATSVKGLMAVAIFISYGLHCYVPVEVVWREYLLPALERRGSQRLLLWEYVLRISLCLITFLFSVSVSRLGLFISLFGALCLSALGICFPAIMELCVWYAKRGHEGYLKVRPMKDIFLFAFGIVGLVAGTYTALLEIVRSFSPKPEESQSRRSDGT